NMRFLFVFLFTRSFASVSPIKCYIGNNFIFSEPKVEYDCPDECSQEYCMKYVSKHNAVQLLCAHDEECSTEGCTYDDEGNRLCCCKGDLCNN
ncbi:hypothetical protein PMAYCL1PPCAC_09024, partial [Pristionchus mayeri]